ncbi:Metallo-hydrolase/oxidoreductase [Backusella circina FSU 941]|nr:Metallo-hydrolase/oxidoreductase [Backusella circina FSU 941]
MKRSAEKQADSVKITSLGAGNEVGRSCILLEYKNKRVLLDAGIHPAYEGYSSLPFFDCVDLNNIDVALITHFHVDHAGGVPFLTEKTNFQGRVFMTHPTKAIFKWLLNDYLRVTNRSDLLYTEQDLYHSYQRIEPIDYHQEINIDGIHVTAYPAGHVLGAAMFLIKIEDATILYTGDYSREENHHLMAAEVPEETVDILITESTYGVRNHEPLVDREERLTTLIKNIVTRGGKCLLPVFALGNSQELLLILDRYWSLHPELHDIPIYYTSNLAKKGLAVYQTYTQMMNKRIREHKANPFVFRHINNLKSLDTFEGNGPCVIMATPGMLQNGLSRELFERWAPDAKNGLVVTGFSVQDTLARQVINESSHFISNGIKKPLKMSVYDVSFSAHVDYNQNCQFIDETNAYHVVLVHGETNTMRRLKLALESRNSKENMQFYNPENCETLKLQIKKKRIAKVVKKLASEPPAQDKLLNGVIVNNRKDSQWSILDMDEITEIRGISKTVISQRQKIPFNSGKSLLKWHLEMTFDTVVENKDILRVVDIVDIIIEAGCVILEWVSGTTSDLIADSILAVVLSIEQSPASVKVPIYLKLKADEWPLTVATTLISVVPK